MLKDNILDNLNDEQKRAVTRTEGPVLINAGAGSGKTRVLTSRIALLMRRGVPPERILALTFTKKAAGEMKDRIYRMTGYSTHGLCMGTFHSVFIKFLRDYAQHLGYPQGFTIYDEDDSESCLKECINEVLYGEDWKTMKKMLPEDKLNELKKAENRYKPKSVQSRISLAKNNLISALQYANDKTILAEDRKARRELLYKIFLLYQKRLKAAGVMDFDDILINTDYLLKKYPEALEDLGHRFDYILVDEYQDTNYAQYSVLRSLTKYNDNICVVGDDSQSIYAFRGAQIENILNFEKDFPDCRTFKLETNYRSTDQIVEAANNIIAHNSVRLPKDCHSAGKKGDYVKTVETATDKGEAQYIAAVICDEVDKRGRSYNEFAILYRTNAQSRALEDILLRAQVPYTIYSGVSFFARMEIKDLLSFFKLAVNCNDNEAFKRAVARPSRGIGNTAVSTLEVMSHRNNTSLFATASGAELALSGLKPRSIQKMSEFVQMIGGFREVALHQDAYSAAKWIAAHSGILEMYAGDTSEEGKRRTENLEELLNNISSFNDDWKAEYGKDATLAEYLEDMTLLSNADTGDGNDDKVSLMTVHCAKGMEYPFVFVTGMEETIFPGVSAKTKEDLEEERRLFYVAVTRAKEKLFVTHAQQRYRFGKKEDQEPSRFLLEMYSPDSIDEDMPNFDEDGNIIPDEEEPGDEW